MPRQTLFLAFLLLATSSASAVNDLAAIRDRGELIVSVKNEGDKWANHHRDPAHFQKRSMEIGIAQAVATEVLGSPVKLQLKTMRKPERLAAVARGDVDLGISMVRVTPEDMKIVDFSMPYYSSGLAVLEREDGSIRSKTDLVGKTIAVVDRHDGGPGAMVSAVSVEGVSPPKVVLVKNFDEGAQAVAEGRAAGLISEAVNIDVFLRGHGGSLKRCPLLTDDRFAVAVQKGNTELLEVVNGVLTKLIASGRLAALADEAALPGMKK